LIHLDTSFLIRAVVPDTDAGKRLRGWLVDGEPLAMSAIAWGEFCCGSLSPGVNLDCRNLLDAIVPFSESSGELAAELFNGTGRRRMSFADCMIAASAIEAEASLATMNGEDFSRFLQYGLTLINPE
jgi:predicted nucleic acid-binding protein